MRRRRKLIARIRTRPSEVDFDDVRRLLEDFGWQKRSKGEHDVFTKVGEREHISLPTVSGRKVKRHYLDRICRILKLDDLDD